MVIKEGQHVDVIFMCAPTSICCRSARGGTSPRLASPQSPSPILRSLLLPAVHLKLFSCLFPGTSTCQTCRASRAPAASASSSRWSGSSATTSWRSPRTAATRTGTTAARPEWTPSCAWVALQRESPLLPPRFDAGCRRPDFDGLRLDFSLLTARPVCPSVLFPANRTKPITPQMVREEIQRWKEAKGHSKHSSGAGGGTSGGGQGSASAQAAVPASADTTPPAKAEAPAVEGGGAFENGPPHVTSSPRLRRSFSALAMSSAVAPMAAAAAAVAVAAAVIPVAGAAAATAAAAAVVVSAVVTEAPATPAGASALPRSPSASQHSATRRSAGYGINVRGGGLLAPKRASAHGAEAAPRRAQSPSSPAPSGEELGIVF